MEFGIGNWNGFRRSSMAFSCEALVFLLCSIQVIISYNYLINLLKRANDYSGMTNDRKCACPTYPQYMNKQWTMENHVPLDQFKSCAFDQL